MVRRAFTYPLLGGTVGFGLVNAELVLFLI
jgi:hypothetical protein